MSPTPTLRTAVLHFLVGTSESHTWIIHCRHQSTKARTRTREFQSLDCLETACCLLLRNNFLISGSFTG